MIGMARERGGYVEVFDENNRQIFCRIGELHGYTSKTVTIKDRQGTLVTWDEKGSWKSQRNP